MALSDKHLRFVDQYMIDMNGTAAYLRAGYTCTEEAARVSASKLLTNPNVVAEIATRQKSMQVKTGMNVEWVLEQYKVIIDNNLKEDPAVAKSALDSVGKHYGMFKDKVEHSGNVTLTYEEQLQRLLTGGK